MRERILRAISLLTDGQIDRFDHVQDALVELRTALEAAPEHVEGETGSEEAAHLEGEPVNIAIARELAEIRDSVHELLDFAESHQKNLAEVFAVAAGNP